MERKEDTTIQFSGLKPGTYDYCFTLDNSFFSEYKNEKILGGKVVFEVKMEKKERLMTFFFNYHGTVQTECDRCLGEMDWPIEGDERLYVKQSDTEQSDDEEIVVLPEKEHKIDLAQWMYEYIAVALPIQCLHPDDEDGNPTCNPEMLKYLAGDDETPTETDERNDDEIDPRWAALKALK